MPATQRGINQGPRPESGHGRAGMIARNRPAVQPIQTTRGFAGAEARESFGPPAGNPGGPGGNAALVVAVRPPDRVSTGAQRAYVPEATDTVRTRHFHFRGFPGRGRFDY